MSRVPKIKIPIVCKKCNREFLALASANRKYCSSACAYASFDRVRHVKPKERGKAKCQNCDKVFVVRTGSGKAKFCSRFCAHSKIGKSSIVKNRKFCRSRARAGWFCIGSKRMFLRSSWEVKYARHLEKLLRGGKILAWEYESKSFDLIVKSYTPDFVVVTTTGAVEYHEVKGWMDARSRLNCKLMASLHPDVKLKLITSVKNLK